MPEETKEIRIYGVSGRDEYRLKGSGQSRIKVRLIGGDQYDEFTTSKAFSNSKQVHIYDSRDTASNRIDLDKKVHLHLKSDSTVHAYEYGSFVYDRKGTIVDFNYGVDRGLIFGLGYLIENQGFRKKTVCLQAPVHGKLPHRP